MSSSYQMEQKAFVKASCIYKIHTGEKVFAAAIFEGLRVALIRTESKT